MIDCDEELGVHENCYYGDSLQKDTEHCKVVILVFDWGKRRRICKNDTNTYIIYQANNEHSRWVTFFIFTIVLELIRIDSKLDTYKRQLFGIHLNQ